MGATMKILAVFPAFEPAWAFGGVVRCTSNLCRALASQGADITVYTTNVNGRGGFLPIPINEPVNISGVHTTYFKSTFGSRSVFYSQDLLNKLSDTITQFDIIYSSAIWQWIGIAAGDLAWKRNIPHIIGTHGSFHPGTLNKGWAKKHLYWHLCLKRCIHRASALHYTTEYERSVSKAFLPKKESFVISNAITSDRLKNSQDSRIHFRKKYNISDNGILLLSVVRPDPVKRLDILLHAFKIILKTIPSVKLILVGSMENKYGVEIMKLAHELNLSNQIIWAGYMSGDKLTECYYASDIFLLTSEHENFSMVAVEAMDSGLPVILSEQTGVADDVQKYNAGTITELNAPQVAQAVINIQKDPVRFKEMSNNASNTARLLYKDTQVAKLMLNAFKDIISGSNHPECRWDKSL